MSIVFIDTVPSYRHIIIFVSMYKTNVVRLSTHS